MKNLLLTLTTLFVLALGAFSQDTPRPAPASPYIGLQVPTVMAPPCALNQTVDPACLQAALQTYYAGAWNAMDQATKDYDIEKAWYEAQIANEEAYLVSCLRATQGDPTGTAGCIMAFDNNIATFWNDFVMGTNAVYATFTATVDSLRNDYNAAVALCCVALSTVTDPENQAPAIEPCGMDVSGVNIICPEGLPLPACIQACKDTFYIGQSIVCSTYQIQVDQAYETLIAALNAAEAAASAAGAACGDDPVCIQAVLDAYNDTFNDSWQTFYDEYFQACQAVAAQQQILLHEMFDCMNRCCPI